MRRANAEAIEKWLRKIDTYNSTPGNGTTRVLFTEPELKSREYVMKEMENIGLKVTQDAIGNIFGTLEGTDPSLSPVWTGSHIDTVLNAGMFDGMAGVVSGMEALKIIKESGEFHKRNIVVVVYTSEEPTRFELSCLGSRAMAGKLSLEDTKKLEDKDGNTLYGTLKDLGYDLNKYDDVKKNPGEVYAAVELHIEQNDVLDKAGIPIGIVKGICAPTNYNVIIEGCQSHAGGTSMSERADAFAAASELALLTERLAKESKGEYVTATVGRVKVFPNAVNVISGYTEISIDIRSIDLESKDILISGLMKGVKEIEEKRNVKIHMKQENHDVPYKCDKHLVETLISHCESLHIPYRKLISGAYHDSLFTGCFTPTAMIFIPCREGISHSRDEWAEFEDIAAGTDLLADTLLALANEE